MDVIAKQKFAYFLIKTLQLNPQRIHCLFGSGGNGGQCTSLTRTPNRTPILIEYLVTLAGQRSSEARSRRYLVLEKVRGSPAASGSKNKSKNMRDLRKVLSQDVIFYQLRSRFSHRSSKSIS
jgi:hypothetical protein